MDKKLKVGIIGCGLIAKKRHIPGFLRLKGDVVLQAVCDRNESLAAETAKVYGIAGKYSDPADMLSKEALDIVDICTPPQTHAAIAVQAIGHGCHVLLEKPMALKVSDCDQMIEAVKTKGVRLCIIHNVLFHPPFRKARELVAKGAIGDFIGMRIFLSDPRNEMLMRKDYWVHKLPGGMIGETGPHPVYMSLAFLSQVKSADIWAKNLLPHPWAPFDEFRIELEGEKAMSSIAVSYTSNRYDAEVDILGTEGSLRLDLQSMLLIRYRGKHSLSIGNLASATLGTTLQTATGMAANAFKLAAGQFRMGHEAVIELFVKGVLSGSPPPVTPQEGREVVRVMEMLVARLNQKYGITQQVMTG